MSLHEFGKRCNHCAIHEKFRPKLPLGTSDRGPSERRLVQSVKYQPKITPDLRYLLQS